MKKIILIIVLWVMGTAQITSATQDDLYAIVKFNGKTGVINSKGAYIIKPVYKRVGYDETSSIFKCGLKSDEILLFDGVPDPDPDLYDYYDKSGKLLLQNISYIETYDFNSNSLIPFSNDNKWGYLDRTLEIVIKPQFEQADNFINGLAFIVINNKCGFINNEGVVVIKPQFDQASDFDYYIDGLARIKINNKYGFINTKGVVVIKPQFDRISKFSDGLASITIDSKDGYINKQGEIIIKPQFDQTGYFYKGYAFVNKTGKWQVINKKGQSIRKVNYNLVNNIGSLKYVEIEINEKYGIADFKGNIIIKPENDEISMSHTLNGLASISIDAKEKEINKQDKIIIKPEIEEYLYFFGSPIFQTNLAIQNRKYGIIDDNEKTPVIRFGYDEILEYPQSYYTMRIGNKWGLLKRCKIISKPIYENVCPGGSGLAFVKLNGKWGCIDDTGTVQIDFQFEKISPFYKGLAFVKLDGKWGYIDTNGTVKINFQFQDARYFSEGLAAVKLDGKWGFIDRTGNIIIEPQFIIKNIGTSYFYFNDGMAIVDIDGKKTCINKEGEIMVSPGFDSMSIFSNGYASFCNKKKWGFINKSGAVVIEAIYDDNFEFFKL